MAKDNTITIEIDPDKLGVCARHEFLVATDQEYRNAALTPQGGLAPGEGGKPEDPVPGTDALNSAAFAAAAA
jgi:hypothetical protein